MVLTPQERRGLAVIVGLLLLGAAHDLWRAARPSWAPPPPAPAMGDAHGRRAAEPSLGADPVTGSDAVEGTDAEPGPTSGGAGRPAPRATAGAGEGLADPGGATLAPASIDLNRDDARTLERLPGVGPVLAGRIVAHRRQHGPFETVEDLRAVRGIGPRMLERLRPWVRVTPPPAARR